MISRTETAGNQQGATPRALMVEIDEDRAGQRLDNFLLSQLKECPRHESIAWFEAVRSV